jgi:Protein of unknown function (DUF3179)
MIFWIRLAVCSLMLFSAATPAPAEPAEWISEGWDKTDFSIARIAWPGTTGKPRNSDLVMHDRQTQSWWQQSAGEAIAGELTWKAGQSPAADSENIAESRDAGTVEVYEHVPGQPPKELPYDVTLAFAAHAFHPDVQIRVEPRPAHSAGQARVCRRIRGPGWPGRRAMKVES